MPYFKTSQEWLDQSAALLEARPATTRVTTRYSIKPVKPRKNPTSDTDSPASPAASDSRPPRASLVLKTYDPVSGVTLKYRTAKAAEVSWLVHASLGRLGRGMAGVPEVPEETMRDAEAAAETPAGTGAGVAAASTAAAAAGGTAGEGQQPQGGAGGGGGKKKKKGKK